MATTWGGKWLNLRELRAGGQAHTFVVKDLSEPASATERVLKRLKNPSAERRTRFEQEIRSIANLEHPNVIQLIDFDLDGDHPYLVTEYCEGGSLSDVAIETIEYAVISEWFLDVCGGLAAVHRSGHVHRDIKPANIFLKTKDGPAVLGDFGLVFVDGEERLTLTQEQVGSRFFMAPELRDGRADDVKASSDIYSLGKLLYWMLSGGKSFDRESHREPKWNLLHLRNDLYLEHVQQLLDRMITVDPASRLDIVQVILNAKRVFELVQNRYSPLTVSSQPCQYCGQGNYQRMSEDALSYIGIQTGHVNRHNFRVLCCSFCGNLQYFWAAQSRAGDWIDNSKVPDRR